jgi:hypothetical protein
MTGSPFIKVCDAFWNLLTSFSLTASLESSNSSLWHIMNETADWHALNLAQPS